MRNFVIHSVLLGLICVAAYPCLSVLNGASRAALTPPVIGQTDYSRLLFSGYGKYKMLSAIRTLTPKDSLFLVFRQSDFAAFAQRRFIFMNNPKLIDVYGAKSKRECYERMRSLGLDYVYVPSYSSPLITNTHLFEVLGDASLSTLWMSFSGYRLYTLKAAPSSPAGAAASRLAGRDMDRMVWNAMGVASAGSASCPQAIEGLPARLQSPSDDGGGLLYSGAGLLGLSPEHCFDGFPVRADALHTVSYSVSGSGLYAAYVVFYNERGGCIGGTKLVDGVLDSSYGTPRRMVFQFVAPSYARQCRLVYELTGKGGLTLHGARIVEGEPAQERLSAMVVYDDAGKGGVPGKDVVYQDPLSALSDRSDSRIWGMVGSASVPSVLGGGVLYTGPGDVESAPLAVGAKRAVLRLRGVGLVDVCLRCFSSRFGGEGGYSDLPLGVYLLPGEDRDVVLDKTLDMPLAYDDYRVVIRPVTVMGLNHLFTDVPMVGRVELEGLSIYENKAQGAPMYGLCGEDWAEIFSLGEGR